MVIPVYPTHVGFPLSKSQYYCSQDHGAIAAMVKGKGLFRRVIRALQSFTRQRKAIFDIEMYFGKGDEKRQD